MSTRKPRTRTTRVDRLTTMWMVLALVVAGLTLLTRGVVPQPWWTLIHVVTLGILSNGILQWSWYFARSLLRLPHGNVHAGRDQVARQILFNLVLIGLVAAMWTGNVAGTIAGAAGIGAVLAWHGGALLVAFRSRLASRFAVVIRFYVAAAFFLIVGCGYAGVITVAMFAAEAPAWILAARDNLTLAHALVNTLGWIGLSIAGTLATLGPTIVRTRMEPTAVSRAMAALPVLIVSLVVLVACATFGLLEGAAVCLLVYVAALAWGIADPLVRTVIKKSPSDYAGWSVSAGLVWTLVGLAALAWQLFLAPEAADFRSGNQGIIALVGVGGILQIFVGSLTYLMPVVVGGGPSSVRVGIRVLDTGAVLRLVLRNAALLLALLTALLPIASLWWLVVAGVFAADLATFVASGLAQVREKRAMSSIALPLRAIHPEE